MIWLIFNFLDLAPYLVHYAHCSSDEHFMELKRAFLTYFRIPSNYAAVKRRKILFKCKQNHMNCPISYFGSTITLLLLSYVQCLQMSERLRRSLEKYLRKSCISKRVMSQTQLTQFRATMRKTYH